MKKEFSTVKIRKKYLRMLSNLIPNNSATKALELLIDLILNKDANTTKLIGETLSERLEQINNISEDNSWHDVLISLL